MLKQYSKSIMIKKMFAELYVWFGRNERIVTDNLPSFLDGQYLLMVQNAIIRFKTI